MISKKVAIKDTGKSNFVRLVKYITGSQNNENRIESISITNCKSVHGIADQEQAINIAMNEILADQLSNKRAQSDRTYHLLISFKAGEHPSPKVLKEIEASFCEALGYGEHQRISAVHNDTDNLHIHVAINKIHPERHTIHEPKNDYWIRDNLCAALEEKYGLQRDNHTRKKSRSEGRADDMEAHTGEKSLMTWIRENLSDQIKAADNWNDVFSLLKENGIVLKKQGNGFVFQSEGITVKASSVDREFSKPNLEKRLGEFPEDLAAKFFREDEKQQKQGRGYKRTPLNEGDMKLYGIYQAERNGRVVDRKKSLEAIKKEQERLIKQAREKAKFKRSVLKFGRGPLAKKIAYAAIQKTLENEIKNIREETKRKRSDLYKPPRSWADWLKERALQGDKAALDALRRRKAAEAKRKGQSDGFKTGSGIEGQQDHVTKSGTVIFKTKHGYVRDDGTRLTFSKQITDEALLFALKQTLSKQGKHISLTGSSSFQERVAKLAGKEGVDVIFVNPALEKMRQEAKNEQNERRSRNRGNAGGGERRSTENNRGRGESSDRRGRGNTAGANRTDRGDGRNRDGGTGGDDSDRADNSTRSRKSRFTSRDEFYRTVREATAADEIDITGFERAGTDKPPKGWNNMQHLSGLNVAGNPTRDEMLVSPDAQHGLDQSSANGNSSMRWTGDSSRTGEAEEVGKAAANKYIQERASKRLQGFSDVPIHRLYEGKADENVIYQGVRIVDGQELLLCKRKGGEDMLVKPVDKKTHDRLKQVKVGSSILIKANGQVLSQPKSQKRKR